MAHYEEIKGNPWLQRGFEEQKLQINTDGLTKVGEITTREQKDFQMEPDFRNALAAGAVEAYNGAIRFAEDRIRAAGPYDDTRALGELIVWCRDKVQEVTGA